MEDRKQILRQMYFTSAPNKRIQRTVQALTESLLALLKTKALEEIRVSELCRIADINRSTFYSYFSNISDLCEFIFSSHYVQIVRELDVLSKGSDVVRPSQLFLERFSSDPVLVFLIKKGISEQYSTTVYRWMADIKLSGCLSPLEEYENYCIYCGTFLLAVRWVRESELISIDQAAEVLAKFSSSGHFNHDAKA